MVFLSHGNYGESQLFAEDLYKLPSDTDWQKSSHCPMIYDFQRLSLIFFNLVWIPPRSHTCSWKQTPDFHIVEIFQINQKLSLQPTDVDFIAESSPQNCLTVLSAKNENYIWTGRSNQRFILEGV